MPSVEVPSSSHIGGSYRLTYDTPSPGLQATNVLGTAAGMTGKTIGQLVVEQAPVQVRSQEITGEAIKPAIPTSKPNAPYGYEQKPTFHPNESMQPIPVAIQQEGKGNYYTTARGYVTYEDVPRKQPQRTAYTETRVYPTAYVTAKRVEENKPPKPTAPNPQPTPSIDFANYKPEPFGAGYAERAQSEFPSALTDVNRKIDLQPTGSRLFGEIGRTGIVAFAGGLDIAGEAFTRPGKAALSIPASIAGGLIQIPFQLGRGAFDLGSGNLQGAATEFTNVAVPLVVFKAAGVVTPIKPVKISEPLFNYEGLGIEYGYKNVPRLSLTALKTSGIPFAYGKQVIPIIGTTEGKLSLGQPNPPAYFKTFTELAKGKEYEVAGFLKNNFADKVIYGKSGSVDLGRAPTEGEVIIHSHPLHEEVTYNKVNELFSPGDIRTALSFNRPTNALLVTPGGKITSMEVTTKAIENKTEVIKVVNQFEDVTSVPSNAAWLAEQNIFRIKLESLGIYQTKNTPVNPLAQIIEIPKKIPSTMVGGEMLFRAVAPAYPQSEIVGARAGLNLARAYEYTKVGIKQIGIPEVPSTWTKNEFTAYNEFLKEWTKEGKWYVVYGSGAGKLYAGSEFATSLGDIDIRVSPEAMSEFYSRSMAVFKKVGETKLKGEQTVFEGLPSSRISTLTSGTGSIVQSGGTWAHKLEIKPLDLTAPSGGGYSLESSEGFRYGFKEQPPYFYSKGAGAIAFGEQTARVTTTILQPRSRGFYPESSRVKDAARSLMLMQYAASKGFRPLGFLTKGYEGKLLVQWKAYLEQKGLVKGNALQEPLAAGFPLAENTPPKGLKTTPSDIYGGAFGLKPNALAKGTLVGYELKNRNPSNAGGYSNYLKTTTSGYPAYPATKASYPTYPSGKTTYPAYPTGIPNYQAYPVGKPSYPATAYPSTPKYVSTPSYPAQTTYPASGYGKTSYPPTTAYPPNTPPPKTPPVIFALSDSGKRKEGRLPRGFALFVRRQGKFLSVPGVFTKETAIGLGAKIVSGSAAATFKIRQAGFTEPKNAPLAFARQKFYTPKTIRRAPGEELYTQRTKYRISSLGEKQEITAKGLQALRNKRGGRAWGF